MLRVLGGKSVSFKEGVFVSVCQEFTGSDVYTVSVCLKVSVLLVFRCYLLV